MKNEWRQTCWWYTGFAWSPTNVLRMRVRRESHLTALTPFTTPISTASAHIQPSRPMTADQANKLRSELQAATRGRVTARSPEFCCSPFWIRLTVIRVHVDLVIRCNPAELDGGPIISRNEPPNTIPRTWMSSIQYQPLAPGGSFIHRSRLL